MSTTTNTPDLLDVFASPLMRAEEVADLLSIKTSTVYELSRRRRDRNRVGRSPDNGLPSEGRGPESRAVRQDRPKAAPEGCS
ncbi:MAG TPA: hypothetical protein VGM33_17440 [Baekduia sp.]|jgi:hypothetical protein